MKHKLFAGNPNFHIGLRTTKTAIAVILAMIIVEPLGVTSSRLIFAMLGAMNAVQPTFKESVSSCLTQIVGVIFGALTGIILLWLSIPELLATGIGIILVITLYNALRMQFSPSLPCFMVVLICTTPDIQPITYAVGRLWDSAIGLSIGLVINTLIYPYDNSRKIRAAMVTLNKELIIYLEDLFNRNEHISKEDMLSSAMDTLAQQLKIFENQLLPLRLRRQYDQLERFRLCQWKARQLVSHMEVLNNMEQLGKLTLENYNLLQENGAVLHSDIIQEAHTKQDIITNYHVIRILTIRQELLDVLNEKQL